MHARCEDARGEDQNRVDFIASICDGFSASLNESRNEVVYCGQDAFEVITEVFGDDFAEADLRNATPEQYELLSSAIADILEYREVTSSIAGTAIRSALRQCSG